MIENLGQDPNTGLENKLPIDLSWRAFQQVPPPDPTKPWPPPPLPPPIQLPSSQMGVASIYTLAVGATYAWPSDVPLFARITPDGVDATGKFVPIWVQPGGVGQSSPYTTSTVSPLPLPATIDLTTGAGGSPNNPLYVTNPPALQTELAVANPQIGASPSYILPNSGRLVLLTGKLVIGTTPGIRFLYFTIIYSPTGVIQFPYIIGQTDQSCTFAGAQGIQNGTLGTILNFALPLVLLPAGSKIGINVLGLAQDDYLDDLDFTMVAN